MTLKQLPVSRAGKARAYFMSPLIISMKIFFAIGCLSMTACVSDSTMLDLYKTVSSSEVGCVKEEIQLSNVDIHKTCPSVATWIATCKSKEFICTHSCAPKETSQTKCKEKLK